MSTDDRFVYVKPPPGPEYGVILSSMSKGKFSRYKWQDEEEFESWLTDNLGKESADKLLKLLALGLP